MTDPDAVYRAFFRSQRPGAWPWERSTVVSAPKRWVGGGRFTLAASVGLALGCGLALTPNPGDPRPSTAPSQSLLRGASADGKRVVADVVPGRAR